MTAMCGDDDAARSGGGQPKERREVGVPASGLEQTAGVAEARSDRLSVEELAPQTVSRPALALSRR